MKILGTNRDLNFKYEIIESLICGLELKGTEVKSIRQAKVNLKEGFAIIRNGEVILKNVHIAHYEEGNSNNVSETRDRKLLLHKDEINKLVGKINQTGYTLAPYKIGFIRNFVKLELAVCKGKKLYDKREELKEKEAKRMIDREIKNKEF